MKKIHIFIALTTLLSLSAFANPVDIKTAKKVAETFMQTQTGKKITLQTIDYADRDAFQNFYVFGTENSFVIISADDCVQPVLGYSTENPFGSEKMPENLFCWLKGYDEQIAYAAKSGQKATSDIANEWKTLVSGNTSKAKSEMTVGPLIQTRWNQNSPYNDLCPGGNATGCVATAMAQIMKYWSTVYDSEIYASPSGFWNYLTKGFGSHSYTPASHPDYGEQNVDFGNATFDWRNMTNTYSSSSTDAEKEAVAKLMYHCGVSVNMNYGESGTSSGADTEDVACALQNYFNYSQSAQYITRASIVDETGQEDLEQWKDMLKAELTATPPRPIQYKGRRIVEGDQTTGHSFICDGYKIEDNNDMFHFNWGWGGDGDAWFVITGMRYPLEQAAIFGIQPITYDAQPSGLEVSVENQNVTLTWTSVDHASSYNVYRDYTLIGNTESNTNTFTDSGVPIGDYEYFVRSVDSQGNVSLPSNIQNATAGFNCSLENLTIEHLQLSYQDGNASLQWQAPYRQQYLDYYTFEGNRYIWGPGAPKDFYWGARFPASALSSGTSLSSVSTTFKTEGEYTLYIYSCTGGIPSGSPVRTITRTFKSGWNTIDITPAVTLDNQNDLWIVFKSTDILWTLYVGEQNADDGNYYSINGAEWKHLTGYSYFISANLSNGNFTYTLYDNGQSIAENLDVPVYTHSNISSNTAHQYTVKTKLGNEETPASNMAGVTIGTASIDGDLVLRENDMMTVTENSSLTVTGDLINNNPDNLIIKDGGQLTTSSENVQATVQKSIEQATSWGDGEYDADGWYFIASPIVPSPDYVISGMTTSDETVGENTIHTFDLYRYNASATLEWENYWNHHSEESPFTIDNGTGYLYASKNGTTIRFKGVINPYSTENNTVTLTNNGWNLIGNPFTCAVTVSKPFSELNNGSSVAYKEAGGIISPCAGIALYGEANETVTFSLVEPQTSTHSPNNLNLVLSEQVVNRDGTSKSSVTIDNAIVSFDEGNQLDKFHFGKKKADLYIPQNKKEYAIVSSSAQGEMPVNFKANENGTYTLTIEAENTNLDYLHLVDNMTGADIDLLAGASTGSAAYTFKATTNDYEARFKLVFNANETDGSSTPSTGSGAENSGIFAYINDGNIIITGDGDTCNASLQVVDMTGRVIVSRDAMNRVSTSEMAAGLYVLRLINGDSIKTQKIVIE